MKTSMKVIFMFACVVFANTLFGMGNLKVSIFPIDAEKAIVSISSLTNSDLKITVTDENQRTVYYSESNGEKSDYRKVFNFSDLDEGSYTLTVVSDVLTSEREFNIEHGKIEVGAEKTTMEPYFGIDNEILRCSYLNFSKEKLTLNVFDGNNLIYTKKLGNEFVVSEGLKISKLQQGNYSAVLSAGGRHFTYPISIN